LIGSDAVGIRASIMDAVSVLGRVFHFSFKDYMEMTISELTEIIERANKNG